MAASDPLACLFCALVPSLSEWQFRAPDSTSFSDLDFPVHLRRRSRNTCNLSSVFSDCSVWEEIRRLAFALA